MSITNTVPPQESDQPRTVSRLAVASLILSLIFCCPLTTIAGIVTGIIAVVFTSTNRLLSGRWIAVLAIVIGLAFTTLQTVGIFVGYNTVLMPILTGPQSALKDGTGENVSAFQSHFVLTEAEGNTPENAEIFLSEVTERYGAFLDASLDQPSSPNQMPAAAQDFVGKYHLNFEQGRVLATCAIEVADAKGALSMKLKSLLIHDAKLGDISFPPTSLPIPKQ